jgi:hypothetical protein
MDCKQGVHFLPSTPDRDVQTVQYRAVFQPSEGDFTFVFEQH